MERAPEPDGTGRPTAKVTTSPRKRAHNRFPDLHKQRRIPCAAVAFPQSPASIPQPDRECWRPTTRKPATLPSHSAQDFQEKYGDPGKTRTSDTQFRKLLLYPPELRGHLRLSDHPPWGGTFRCRGAAAGLGFHKQVSIRGGPPNIPAYDAFFRHQSPSATCIESAIRLSTPIFFISRATYDFTVCS